MKVEIGESLGYSFLRHVAGCWLVQTNWKASDHWTVSNLGELEQSFRAMREKFDPDGSVFGKTSSSSQLLKQGEIDVVGVGTDGSVYTVEIAFHEGGLLYSGGTVNQVLKKMLRTKLILDAYHPGKAKRHIYFASPKVNPTPQRSLEAIFDQLRQKYQSIDWQLLTNKKFTEELLTPTLAKVGTAADTSELFVRSAKLLELGGLIELSDEVASPRQETSTSVSDTAGKELGQIQPLVQNLMQTLLDESSSLLTESDISNLMDRGYCQERLGLELGGFALLRQKDDGREISGHDRYWVKVYADRFYVTSQWWKDSHHRNAAALLSWVDRLIQQSSGQSAATALEQHRVAFQNYLGLSG